jgi:hypothetical protein
LSIFNASWKWLESSTIEMDKSLSSSLLHFWSALTDFFSLLLSLSNNLIVLERDLMVFTNFALKEDLSSSSSPPFASFLRALMIFNFASGLSAFYLASCRYFAPFLPLSPWPPVTNAVPCAGMTWASNLSSLYLFIRVKALWISLGYASVFPLE